MESRDIFEFRETGQDSSGFESVRSEESYDVTIRVGDEYFKAHRLVLTAVIPFFKAMFTSRMKEATAKEIPMENIDPVVLKCVIDFAYTNSLKVGIEEVPTLLETCIYLQLDNVTDACLKFLWKQIDPDTVLRFREWASRSNNACMVEKADQYVRENFDDVSLSEEFLDMPFLTLKEIIQRDDLNALNEETVFESILRWVKASEDERRLRLPELLRHIRMTLLAPKYLVQRVATEELIESSPLCKNIVEAAKNYHSLVNRPPRCIFRTQPRYCKSKHHLRCEKLMGYGMYSVCHVEGSKLSLRYYDQMNKKWDDLPFRCLSKTAEYVACTEQKIYTIGLRFIESFHLRTLESTSKRLSGNHPQGAGIALYQSKIFLIGGLNDSSNLVNTLDPETAQFSEVGRILSKRAYPSAVTLSDSIYITGGDTDTAVLNSVEKYNPVTGRSIEVSSMRCRRWGHACATHDGKIYVCGGNISKAQQYNFNNFTNSAEEYNPATDQWVFIREMNYVRLSVSLFSHASKLYAVDADCFEVETYNSSRDVWERTESFIFSGRCQTVTVVLTNSASVIFG